MTIKELIQQYKESVPHVVLQPRKLMDPSAPNASTGVVNGHSSNVLNWNDTRYPWAYPMYKRFLGNFWTPFEVNMLDDIKQFPNMTEDQRDTFLKIFGLLTFLDSIQSDYSSKVAESLTDSSLQAIMIILAQQEVIHNHSYSYVMTSVSQSKEEQDIVFEFWKHDETLKKRNQFIVEGYEQFTQDEDTIASLLVSLAYDVVLEGLFFYSGFAFFYDLARDGKMVGSSTMINYINRDEQQHVNLFCNIFKTILEENPEFNTPQLQTLVTEIFRQASEHEIEWSQYIIGHKFDSINVDELAGYVRFMANLRCKMLGVPTPFPKQETNPMEWIKFYEDMDLGKTDFFEQKVRQYNKTDDTFNDTEELDLDDLDLDI
jgi:ribonucleoside-diphosphate reductase beta chain